MVNYVIFGFMILDGLALYMIWLYFKKQELKQDHERSISNLCVYWQCNLFPMTLILFIF